PRAGGPRRQRLGRGPGRLPPAPAADPDDLGRLHHGRRAPGAVDRGRLGDAPGHGGGGVLRHAGRDPVRPRPDPRLLLDHPPPDRPRPAQGSQGRARPGSGGMTMRTPMRLFKLALLAGALAAPTVALANPFPFNPFSVGPTYVARDPRPAVLLNADPKAVDLAAEPGAAWWRVFEDPVLDDLVGRAVAGNLDLRQAEARVRQARAIFKDRR